MKKARHVDRRERMDGKKGMKKRRMKGMKIGRKAVMKKDRTRGESKKKRDIGWRFFNGTPFIFSTYLHSHSTTSMDENLDAFSYFFNDF